MFYLKPAGRVQWDRCGAVLLCDAVTCVAVRGLVVAEAASNHATLFKVCSTALTCVTAHTVLSTAGLKDGLPGNGLTIFHIHKQPGQRIRQVTETETESGFDCR